jgi:hypothetical protein
MRFSRPTRILTQLTLAAWILWGSGPSEPPSTTPIWRPQGSYATEAACASALTAEQQARPQLSSSVTDEMNRRTTTTHVRRFQCVLERQQPTGQP